MRYLRRPSTFLLPSASTNFTCLHRKDVPHRNICSSCLSAEYCLGVPKVNPNKKPRKIFFVKNDYAQYGRELKSEILFNEVNFTLYYRLIFRSIQTLIHT